VSGSHPRGKCRQRCRRPLEQPAEHVGIALEPVARIGLKHFCQRLALIVTHAGVTRALVPDLDRFGLGADVSLQGVPKRRGDLDLAHGRRADQFVTRAGMSSLRQHQRGSFRDVVEIDEAELGIDRVGHAIKAVANHAIPFGERILHVGGGLQDGDVEPGAEQHLLDPQLGPMMRHRLDLRMQHRVIDKTPDTVGDGGGDKGSCEWQLVGAHIGADVIDRVGSAYRLRPRVRVIHLADHDVVDTDRVQGRAMRVAPHQGTNDCTTRDQRLQHGHACFSACAGDQDHVRDIPKMRLSMMHWSWIDSP